MDELDNTEINWDDCEEDGTCAVDNICWSIISPIPLKSVSTSPTLASLAFLLETPPPPRQLEPSFVAVDEDGIEFWAVSTTAMHADCCFDIIIFYSSPLDDCKDKKE